MSTGTGTSVGDAKLSLEILASPHCLKSSKVALLLLGNLLDVASAGAVGQPVRAGFFSIVANEFST